jgi:hypothetical protein
MVRYIFETWNLITFIEIYTSEENDVLTHSAATLCSLCIP